MHNTRFFLIVIFAFAAVGALIGYTLSSATSSPSVSPSATSSSSPSVSPLPSSSASAMPSVSPYTSPSVSPSAVPPSHSVITAPSSAKAVKTGRCTTTDLTVNVSTSSGTAGSVYQSVVFTNKSMTDCTMYGYPGAALTSGKSVKDQIGDAAGRDRTSTPATVTLAPGKTATATLRVTDAANYPQDQGHIVTSAYLQVYVPDEGPPVYVPDVVQGTTVTSVPLLSITPVKG